MRSVVWSQSPCECQCVAEFTQVQRVIRAETAVKAEPVSAAIVSAHTDWTSRAGPDDTLVFHQHSVISAPPQGSSCVMAGVFFTHPHFIFKLLNIFLITLPTRLNLQDAVVLTERHVSPPSSVWGHYWSHSSTAAPQIISSLRHVRRNSLILRKRQRADSALYDCCQTGRNIELSQSHNWENRSGSFSDSSSE